MSLLETVVFSNIVKIISSEDDSPLHLQLGDCSTQDTTPYRDVSCEWALLVDVLALDSLTRYLESQADIPCVPQLFLRYLLLQF